jgi:small subunit ribosomal protein S17
MPDGRRKVRQGEVVSDKMDKTVIVAVEWRRPHRIYKKPVRRKTRFMVHDPENECKLGDTVRIREGRPLSKTKRWRVMDILQREDIAEVQPGELTAADESNIIAEAQAIVDVSAKVAYEDDAPETDVSEEIDDSPTQ